MKKRFNKIDHKDNRKQKEEKATDPDYSCCPLLCGSLHEKTDKRLACQLLHNVLDMMQLAKNSEVREVSDAKKALEQENQSKQFEQDKEPVRTAVGDIADTTGWDWDKGWHNLLWAIQQMRQGYLVHHMSWAMDSWAYFSADFSDIIEEHAEDDELDFLECCRLDAENVWTCDWQRHFHFFDWAYARMQEGWRVALDEAGWTIDKMSKRQLSVEDIQTFGWNVEGPAQWKEDFVPFESALEHHLKYGCPMRRRSSASAIESLAHLKVDDICATDWVLEPVKTTRRGK